MATTGYCVKCKSSKDMKGEQQVTLKNGRAAVKGKCSSCDTSMFRILGKAKQEARGTIEAKELAIRIARLAKDTKAEKVIILDLRALAAFCDFFVIMSGTSNRHLLGLNQTIEQELIKHKIKPLFSGQKPESGWIILDYANVVVHIFQRPQREFYALEYLWQDAKRIRIPARQKSKRAGQAETPLICTTCLSSMQR